MMRHHTVMRRVTVPCLTTQALPPYKKSRIRINKYTVFSINVERITRLELGSRDFSPAAFTLGKDVCEKNSGRETHPLFSLSAVAGWRRHPDSDRGSGSCSPLPYHLAIAPYKKSRILNTRIRSFHYWSGLRGSNSLPPPWQGGALPDELNPHIGEWITGSNSEAGIFDSATFTLGKYVTCSQSVSHQMS